MGNVYYQVDAFTNTKFSGNPAAVFVLTEQFGDKWMQSVASELNLSETAFLFQKENGFSLRWFTPVDEVDLCGHATLASAHILWEQGYLSKDSEAFFYTKSGLLTARREGEWITLNFPTEPEKACDYPDELLKGLGVKAKYVGRNRLDYIVEVDSEESLRSLQPNWSILERVRTRGVIVTSRSSSSEFDFVSRSFFPSIGINEDPVTGSAHCCLAPYWRSKLGKDEFIAYQASPRGGTVKVKVQGDRVLLTGQAITVIKGETI